jgi:hypothetical protein
MNGEAFVQRTSSLSRGASGCDHLKTCRILMVKAGTTGDYLGDSNK